MASPLSASLMCAFAERAVQSVLQYDPATRHRLTPLENQVIHFDISDLSISIYLLFHHDPYNSPEDAYFLSLDQTLFVHEGVSDY